jgi:adenine-specific DNA-methyltransferase
MPKATVADIRSTILKLVPRDGTSVGNMALREQVADRLGAKVGEDDYFEARDALVDSGKLVKG